MSLVTYVPWMLDDRRPPGHESRMHRVVARPNMGPPSATFLRKTWQGVHDDAHLLRNPRGKSMEHYAMIFYAPSRALTAEELKQRWHYPSFRSCQKASSRNC